MDYVLRYSSNIIFIRLVFIYVRETLNMISTDTSMIHTKCDKNWNCKKCIEKIMVLMYLKSNKCFLYLNKIPYPAMCIL